MVVKVLLFFDNIKIILFTFQITFSIRIFPLFIYFINLCLVFKGQINTLEYIKS